jgi:cytochrome c biogenesis protein CcdA
MSLVLRVIVAIVIIGHGIGHVVGFLAPWTNSKLGFPEFAFNQSPWLFPGEVLMQSAIGKVFGAIWLLSMVAFFGAALGLLARQEWWSTVAVIASILSLIVVVPWWNSFTPGIMSKRSAVFVDIVVLVALWGPWKDEILARLNS